MTDPQSLQEYEQVYPGAAKLILDQWFKQTEAEQRHRHEMEKAVISNEDNNAKRLLQQGDRGQRFALVVALTALAVVVLLAYWKEPVLAGIIGTLDIGGLVAVFIYGKSKQQSEAAPASGSVDDDDDPDAESGVGPQGL